MGAPQMIRTETGEELVVLSRHDYDVLLARSGDPDAEDRITAALVAASEGEVALPLAVWDELDGVGQKALGSRLAIIRRVRGLSQEQLAQASDVPIDVIADLERGGEVSVEAFARQLARALRVDRATLLSEID